MRDRARSGGGRASLGFRLAAAFVAVSVAAVLVFAALTLWRSRHTVGQLARERQQENTWAIARTLALAYQSDGAWGSADPHPAMMLAVQAGASVTVLDADGRRVELRSPMLDMTTAMAAPDGPQRRAAVVVNGATVGTAVVTFTRGDLAQAETHVRDAIRGSVLIGAGVAALAALAVAVPFARRVVRPLTHMTDIARQLGAGDTSARAGDHDAPGELGTLARTFDDMADRLQAHEATRRNLTADIAHELRTPLTILQGNCEEIIDGITQPSLERFDLDTLADADRATTGPSLRAQPCDLALVVGAAIDRLVPLIDAHQHQLKHHLEPVTVEGDPVRLGQIATNLVSNAVKFSPPGSHIEVSVGPADGGRIARLEVTDNGPGIPPSDREHVFERFYRGAATRSIAGSGIGLAVVDQLVRAHHGRVHLGDATIGTSVVVELPAR